MIEQHHPVQGALFVNSMNDRGSSCRGLPIARSGVAIRGTLLLAGLLLSSCATDGADQSFTAKMEAFSERLSRSIDPAAKSFSETASPYADSLAGNLTDAGKRMQKYVANREVLKGYKDTGLHNEGSLLALLKQVGVADGGEANRSPDSDRPIISPTFGSGDWRWPVDAGIITSEFGARWGKQHRGMDIAADTGEPVIAMADGEVVYSDNKMRGYGNVIVIKHVNSMTSLYAHNDELIARVGEKVVKGQVVSLLGNTGRSTGPHVHFEIRQGKDALDPYALLPSTELPVAWADDADEKTRLVSNHRLLKDRPVSAISAHRNCDHPPIDKAWLASLIVGNVKPIERIDAAP